MNTVKRVIQLDTDTQMVSKEALVAIVKATEMFVKDLAGVTA